jgi:hypothetical protein
MKVKYIDESDPWALLNGKVYEVLSIEGECYRIIDETGEDYLYHPDEFEIVDDAGMKEMQAADEFL